MDVKTKPILLRIKETHPNIKNKYHVRVKGWKKIFQANGPKKETGVAILIADKIDFKLKLIRKDSKGYYELTKGKPTKMIFQFLVSMPQTQGTKVYKRNTTAA